MKENLNALVNVSADDDDRTVDEDFVPDGYDDDDDLSEADGIYTVLERKEQEGEQYGTVL